MLSHVKSYTSGSLCASGVLRPIDFFCRSLATWANNKNEYLLKWLVDEYKKGRLWTEEASLQISSKANIHHATQSVFLLFHHALFTLIRKLWASKPPEFRSVWLKEFSSILFTPREGFQTLDGSLKKARGLGIARDLAQIAESGQYYSGKCSPMFSNSKKISPNAQSLLRSKWVSPFQRMLWNWLMPATIAPDWWMRRILQHSEEFWSGVETWPHESFICGADTSYISSWVILLSAFCILLLAIAQEPKYFLFSKCVSCLLIDNIKYDVCSCPLNHAKSRSILNVIICKIKLGTIRRQFSTCNRNTFILWSATQVVTIECKEVCYEAVPDTYIWWWGYETRRLFTYSVSDTVTVTTCYAWSPPCTSFFISKFTAFFIWLTAAKNWLID